MPFLWHFTDLKALEKIENSKKLYPSLRAKGDAYHGNGVYFTDLPPESKLWEAKYKSQKCNPRVTLIIDCVLRLRRNTLLGRVY